MHFSFSGKERLGGKVIGDEVVPCVNAIGVE